MKQLNRHIYSSSSVWNFLFIENVLLWIVLLHWCIWVFDIQFENPKIQGFFCCFIFSPFLRANILSEQIFFFVFHQKNCFYNFHFFFLKYQISATEYSPTTNRNWSQEPVSGTACCIESSTVWQHYCSVRWPLV